ncbi:MAG: pantetheine-phosphate adenylyltransferase [Ruminococcus sp.]|nr:pantetheine-phosphate adenylyltransferase [Ruminococcus sp.]
MNKSVICPGSFDPVTLGHLDIITRASKMFDRVYVAALVNATKKHCFTPEERMTFMREALQGLDNVEVVSFDGLLAEYCRKHNIDAIVKGLRAVSDFEYEFQMAIANKRLNPQLETIFLTSDADFTYLSSSMVREIGAYGGDISNFVPACVHDRIVQRLRKSK